MYDTSKKALEEMGIELTESQYNEICKINLHMATEDKPIPVYHILYLLKILGVLNTDCKKDDCRNNSN